MIRLDSLTLDVVISLVASIEARGFEWGLSTDELGAVLFDAGRDKSDLLHGMASHLMLQSGLVRLRSETFRLISGFDAWPRARAVRVLRNGMGERLHRWCRLRGSLNEPMPLGEVGDIVRQIGATEVEVDAAVVQAHVLEWVHVTSLARGRPLVPGVALDDVKSRLHDEGTPTSLVYELESRRARWTELRERVRGLAGPYLGEPRKEGSAPAQSLRADPSPRSSTGRLQGAPVTGAVDELVLPRPRSPSSSAYAKPMTVSQSFAAVQRDRSTSPPALGPTAPTSISSPAIERTPSSSAIRAPMLAGSITPRDTPVVLPTATAPVRAAPDPAWTDRLYLLNTALREATEEHFLRGDLEQALRVARKLLIDGVHQRTRLPGDSVQVFDRAFTPHAPVLLVPQPGPRVLPEVQAGWWHLYLGALEVVHVPADGRPRALGQNEVFQRLAFVSLLLDVLDRSVMN